MPWKKGQSGNPSGRPGVVKEIQELARSKKTKAFKKIVSLIDSQDEKVALAAAKEVLDRAYGRAPQSVALTGADGGAIETKVTITQEEAQARIPGLLEALGIPTEAFRDDPDRYLRGISEVHPSNANGKAKGVSKP